MLDVVQQFGEKYPARPFLNSQSQICEASDLQMYAELTKSQNLASILAMVRKKISESAEQIEKAAQNLHKTAQTVEYATETVQQAAVSVESNVGEGIQPDVRELRL